MTIATRLHHVARRRLSALAIALSIAAVLGMWIWQQGAERRQLRAMPESDRVLLYRHTFEDLQATCANQPSRRLGAYCDRQARFLLEFDECDAACSALARSQLEGNAR